MEVNGCREALASILATEVAQLTELASLLEREHGVLVANDIPALEALMAQRGRRRAPRGQGS